MENKYKNRAVKFVAFMLFVVLFLQMTYTSVFGAYIINIHGSSSDSSANKYTDLKVFSGFHSLSAGRAGTFSLDDYSLTLSGKFNSVNIDTGTRYPVNISFNYNTNEYNYLKNIAGINCDSFGGWLTNYNTFLSELEYTDKKQIAWFNGSEKAMIFEQTDDITPEEAEEFEGADKWLPVENTDGNIILWRITEESYRADAEEYPEDDERIQYALYVGDEYIYGFDYLGRFIVNVDIQNEKDYRSAYRYMEDMPFDAFSKLVDDCRNEYRFIYADEKLSKIKCFDENGNATLSGDGESPLEMNFEYGNGNLTKVIYPDGNAVKYSYDPNGRLVSAENIDKSKITVEYNSNGFVEYFSKQIYNSDKKEYTVQNSITVTAPDNSTRIFTDEKGNSITKTFDSDGKILTITDGSGNIIFGGGETGETTTVPEDTTVPGENTTEPDIPWEDLTYVKICKCSGCSDYSCTCTCANEDECNCIQCKRKYASVTDENGNILEDTVFDGVRSMSDIYTYTENGAYMMSSTDSSGNTVYYNYNTSTGLLDSLASGDSQIDFSYNAMGNLTKLCQDVTGLSNGTQMSNEYGYENDNLVSITHNGFSYNFEYDDWGNQTKIKVGNSVLTENIYTDDGENSQISKVTYANGQSVSYSYNGNGQISDIYLDDDNTARYSFEYDEAGNIKKATDNGTQRETIYTESGIEIKDKNKNTNVYSYSVTDDNNVEEVFFGDSANYNFSEENDTVGGTSKQIAEVDFTSPDNVGSHYKFANTKDWFGRTTEKKVDAEFTENENILNINGKYSIIYADTDTTASSKILSYKTDFTFNNGGYSKEDFYEYDNRGNITGIYNLVNGEKSYAHKYVYDEANQLVREDFPSQNQTIKYTYDKGGNIVSKEVFDYCAGEITGTAHNYDSYYYTYSDSIWKDMLTSVNGNAVKSDAMGNITEYNGVTYEWNAGRQLSKTTDKDGESMLYYYNEDGFLAKIESYDVDGNYAGQRDYIWNGDRLVGLCFNSNDFDEAYEIRYVYDSDGEIQGCLLNNKGFILFEKNLQGDVSGLISTESNRKIADIAYDGYGHGYAENYLEDETGTVLANIFLSPVFYRGYLGVIMSDGELMLFLGSRFYNPELCRFFNADIHTDTQQGAVGTNMFAYCNNNPINFIDPCGEAANPLFAIVQMFNRVINLIKRLFGKSDDNIVLLAESYHFTDDMSVDTDGMPYNKYNDPYYQRETSYSYNTPSVNYYLNADIVNYIVIPSNHNKKTKVGDIGVIYNKSTGQYVYAIVGDVGAENSGYKEVSIHAARCFEPSANAFSCSAGRNFVFIIFAESKISFSKSDWENQTSMQQKIDQQGAYCYKKYINKTGRYY